MFDETTKPIEQVKTGDVVESRNEKSGKTEPEKVTATIKHYNVPTVTLTFSNGDQVVTTGVHPFYVKDKGFVPASQLAIGNAIVTRAGPAATITKIEQTAPETVYNITVDGDHTYFVGSKDGGVWVHNTDPLVCPTDTVRLWRAVEDPELADIYTFGDYNIHPNSTLKRFALNEGDVDTFINNPLNAPLNGGNYTKTYVDVPSDKFATMGQHEDPGGAGTAAYIDVYENPEFYTWFDQVHIVP